MRLLELYKYNPGQCRPEELEATFVAREAVIENILSVLRERACTPTNQHFLLIGPRGIGKTNMLLMLKYRVENDDALFRAYIPLQTAEEEYSILSLRDLFTRVLELLLSVDEDEDLRAAAESVSLTDDDENAAEIAIDAVKRFCERSDRKILLLLDNFDLILDERILDDAQMGRLRDLLMNGSFLTLLATAPTHFKEVSGYQRPFYQFFHPIELKDLSVKEMTELLQKQATLEENRTLLGHFKELKPRIEAVYHLTGGNPRLALMLYQLYTRTELPEVRASIQILLDDLTPYYKHRMEVLAPQQRKVLDTFARLGRPATPTELSRETRLKVNQINSILKRLRDLGFVSVSPQKRRKTTLYMVSERVFRIWHQMRFSTPGRKKLEFFIEFLRIWYTEQEWLKETLRLMSQYQSAAAEREFVEAGRFVEHLEYLAEASPRAEMGYSVTDATISACIESGDFKRAKHVINDRINEYSRKKNNDRLAQCWYLMGYLRNEQGRTEEEIQALEKAVQFLPEFPEALSDWGNALGNLARTKEGEEQERLFELAFEKYEAAVKVKPDKHEALNNWGTALVNLARTKEGAEQERLFELAFEKYEAAIKVKPDFYEALTNWGTDLGNLASTKEGAEQERLFELAFEKYEAAIKVKPDFHEALNNWGAELGNLARTKQGAEQERLFELAFEKYEAAIKVKPDFHEALNNWGTELGNLARTKQGAEQERLFELAFEKYEAAIKVKPDFHEALNNWGTDLGNLASTKEGAEQKRLFELAFEKYEAAIKVKPDKHEALYNWGTDLGNLARTKQGAEQERLFELAFEKYEAAVKVKPDFHEALYNWGTALVNLARTKQGAEQERLFELAFEKYEAAVKVKPDKHEALNNWGTALVNLARTKEGAEQERLFELAFEKYEAAIKVKPDFHKALNNWGNALGNLASTKQGAEQERLFEDSLQKINQAVRIASSQKNQGESGFYAAHFMHLTLLRCEIAVKTENIGQARNMFELALDQVPIAREDLALHELFTFFKNVLTEQTAGICAELFGLMQKRNLKKPLGVLEPISKAIEYWQKDEQIRDEVLDRLNPEVREAVEAIIQGDSTEIS